MMVNLLLLTYSNEQKQPAKLQNTRVMVFALNGQIKVQKTPS